MFESLILVDENSTEYCASLFAKHVKTGMVIFLHGELGVGKTTFVRFFLRTLGYKEAVKSPTYTLVEEYHLLDKQVFHFDLYRLSFAEELEYIGIREYFREDSIVFIEWPERGFGILPEPDIVLTLNREDEKNDARLLYIKANTELGKKVVSLVRKNYEKI